MLKKATSSDLATVAALAADLWPCHTPAELEVEFAPILEGNDTAVFLAFSDETAVGFAQCCLRHDYVEGTDSTPVGYLEGIYVDNAHRRRGYAKLLLAACETWSKEHNCQEFASDCELENTQSLHFHLNMGFTEVNRIICFSKRL